MYLSFKWWFPTRISFTSTALTFKNCINSYHQIYLQFNKITKSSILFERIHFRNNGGTSINIMNGLIRGGSRWSDWGDRPPEIYESNLIHHNFNNSKNSIRTIRAFFRPLFCHSSAVKYTSSLLQSPSPHVTWLPNITEIAPPQPYWLDPPLR